MERKKNGWHSEGPREEEVFFFASRQFEGKKEVGLTGRDWQECGQLKRREIKGCSGCGVRFFVRGKRGYFELGK